MSVSGSRLMWLSDARLRPWALARAPAWLWSADATHLIWANPTGAAIFGAATPGALATRRFDAGQPAAAQVARLAETLPADGTARLERLRGFGAGVGRALTCNCSRVMLADAAAGVLILATAPAGPALPLAERATRLLAGSDEPVAIFSSDGKVLAATAVMPAVAPALIEKAQRTGYAEAHIGNSAILLHRIDGGVVASLGPQAAAEMPAPAQDSPDSGPANAEIGPESRANASSPPIPPPPPTPARPPIAERRYPLRFVWQMNADGRFTIGSDEFLRLIGPRSAAALGGRWDDLAATLGIDPDGHVAHAINSHDTWSGLSIAWPVDDSDERLAIELSGLPVFDRDRSFRGYRGFGVCRDLARLHALAQSGRDSPAEQPAIAEQPALPVQPAPAENVVPSGAAAEPAVPAPSLSPVEHRAFSELARRLTTRLSEGGLEPQQSDDGEPYETASPSNDDTLADLAEAAEAISIEQDRPPLGTGEEAHVTTPRGTRSLLDRLPLGVLVYRLEHLLYANRAFLNWTGHEHITSLMEAGGLNSLLIQPAGDSADGPTFAVTSEQGSQPALEGRLISVQWDGEEAHALVITTAAPQTDAAAPETAAQAEIRDLKSILDTATDGVLVLDRDGRITSANRSAQALFGDDEPALVGHIFTELFASESEKAARDYFARLLREGVASVLNRGLDVIGRERQGGFIPLSMTLGRLGEGSDKICAVFRDVTQWKKTEEELTEAKRQAERASSAKSDFLAKVSHEIRTPLNSIIGFSEVMMQERFGPIGNERYRDYLRDIRASGMHLISLINDLLDLSKIEAGKMELTFTGVALNDVVQECVAAMQPQANRGRIIIRTSLSPRLPHVTADARSLKQIVLNLLSNSLKFTSAGGQVIVSTTVSDAGDVSLHVRDTGAGMSEQEIATALEPFRQLSTSTRFGSGGTGLGLPLTKAMAEANRASFHISSKPQAGTLAQVTFAKEKMAAE